MDPLPPNAGDPRPARQDLLDVLRRLFRRRALRWAALAVLSLAVVGAVLAWSWTRELPAFDTLKDYRPLVATRVFGADGSEVFVFARERRTVVPKEEIPDVLRKAVISAEDARFYEHQGVNYLAIAKCAVRGVLRGRLACGGSTITQQVVKTFLLQSDWRGKRKVKELVLAPRLEQNLSKDDILYLYLNQIYFGHGCYGVEEASRYLFGKPVKSVTLGEAAMLAGVIQSPARWSPVRHPAGAKERQRYVLRRMAEEGYITQAQLEQEERRPIVTSPPEANPPGDWYADAVRRWLDEHYGAEAIDTEGFQVEVAMDPLLQRYAESAMKADLRAVDKRQGWRGPLGHLDEKRIAAAVPAWRKRLEAAARPGEVMVWDLSRVDAEDIEPQEEAEDAVTRMAQPRPLEAGEVYGGLVIEVREKAATVDLGGAVGVLPLSDVAWARKFNPAASTAMPRQMSAVVSRGDVVLARVMQGKSPVVQTARAGKPLTLSLEQVPLVQGAFVVVDPATRGVRALVGGYDFATSQFNRALQAKRQPGSAFKPFVWGAAIESRRFTPATIVYDTPDLYRDPWTGKEWKPKNFEKDSFDGPMLLQRALAHSKNTVAVKLLDALGVERVADFAKRMGIAGELPRNLTLALGTGEVTPLELVNAYASIAAQGRHAEPVLVLRVRDRTGAVLHDLTPGGGMEAPLPPAEVPGGSAPGGSASAAPAQPAPPSPPPIAPPPGGDGGEPIAAEEPWTIPAQGTRPDVAYVLTSMMRDVIENGTGVAAKALARPAAAKTGTAQDHRDAWFVGFTPELVAGVWVGFDDHSPLGGRETGAGAALPAWLSFMQAAVGGRPPTDFGPPPGVEQTPIDLASGLRAEGMPTATSPLVAFIAGTAPKESVGDHPGAAPESFFFDEK